MNKILAFFVGSALLLSAGPAFASVSITLSGANPAAAQQGKSFSDPGFSAFSTVDGDITNSVNTSGPDTGNVGTSFRTYSVTDSALDTASASRQVIVSGGGGTMPFCSGPMAPGWNAGLPGGGCGGTDTLIPAGAPGCAWFMFAGCILKQ